MMHKHISQTPITHGLFHSRGVERKTFSNRNLLDLSITLFVDLVASLNQHIQVEKRTFFFNLTSFILIYSHLYFNFELQLSSISKSFENITNIFQTLSLLCENRRF